VTRRTSLLLLASALALGLGFAMTQVASGGAASAATRRARVKPVPLVGFTPIGKHKRPGPPKPPPASSVTLTDQMWVCTGPVDLDSVTVTMTPNYPSRRGGDAVHLENGCTGRIGKLKVTTSIADGVKIGEGAHDLAIGGGSVRCLAKLPGLHQDGIQAMGGLRITLRNLTVDCGRSNERLINSNLFIKKAGRSLYPPTDVVCVDCYLGGSAAHTVSIQESVRSGVRASTLCSAKYSKLTLDVGPKAVDPVTAGDSLGTC
jgi:hypothetical protein